MRAAQFLVLAAKARALMRRPLSRYLREFARVHPVLRHRISEFHAESTATAGRILERLLRGNPRQTGVEICNASWIRNTGFHLGLEPGGKTVVDGS